MRRHLGAAHEERLRGELSVLLLLGARVRGIRRVVNGVHGGILRVAVHPLGHLRRLGVETAAMLVVCLRGRDRGGRVGLGGVVDGRVRALHLGGGSHQVGSFGGRVLARGGGLVIRTRM